MNTIKIVFARTELGDAVLVETELADGQKIAMTPGIRGVGEHPGRECGDEESIQETLAYIGDILRKEFGIEGVE